MFCYHSTRIRQLFCEYFIMMWQGTRHLSLFTCEFLSCYRQSQIPSMEGYGWVFFYINSYSVSVINNQAGAQVWSHHQLYPRIAQQKERPSHSHHAKAYPLIATSQDAIQCHLDNRIHRNNMADFMSYRKWRERERERVSSLTVASLAR